MIALFTVLFSSIFFTAEDVETSKIRDHPQNTLYNQTFELTDTIKVKDTLTLGAKEPVKFSVITEQPKFSVNIAYSSPSVATPALATPSTSRYRGNTGKNSSKINNSRRRRDTDSGCCGCCRRADFDNDNAGNGNGRRNSNCCDGCGSCSCSCSCPSTS